MAPKPSATRELRSGSPPRRRQAKMRIALIAMPISGVESERLRLISSIRERPARGGIVDHARLGLACVATACTGQRLQSC